MKTQLEYAKDFYLKMYSQMAYERFYDNKVDSNLDQMLVVLSGYIKHLEEFEKAVEANRQIVLSNKVG